MKKLVTIIIVSALAFSCGQRRSAPVADSGIVSDVINVADSLGRIEGKGEVVTDVFEGTIPAADAPGQVYTLKLIHQKDLDHGVYQITQAFIDKGDNGSAIFHSFGRYFMANTGDSIVITAEEFGESGINYYYVNSEDAITLLDMSGHPIESEHNYTLKKK